jgi:2-polyprenyl-3-methyl-5-hydroxy-6-metoxy-1,4-benzoquinol methylase
VKEALRTIEVPRCTVCGELGRALYGGLRDRVFSVPGVWSIARCPQASCGLLWLNPMPSQEDVHRVYESYYTHVAPPRRRGALGRLLAAAKRGYVANHFDYQATGLDRALGLLAWLYPGRPAELDFSVMWLHGERRGRLLDIGAGSGWLIENMNALGWKAEGLDFDPRAVELARARGLTVHRGGLLEAGFEPESFDAVTMSHNIEHVHDPVAWLAEARRVLRPGGRLALATPNTRSYLHRRFREHWFPLEPPRHLHLFNRQSLDAVLQRAGFTQYRLFTSSRDAPGVFLASRAIRKSGRCDANAGAAGADRLRGRMVQLRELQAMLLDSDAGEDLVAMALR